MKFYSSLIDSNVGFRQENEVISTITSSKNYKNETFSNAKTLNFFETSKQRSYLIATNEMVYCVVDDKRKEAPRINWSEKKEQFAKTDIKIRDKTNKTGLVDFGDNHKNWLFSKAKLQGKEDFKEQISKLLTNDFDN